MATLQVVIFGRYKIFGAVPDLMLCTVVCVAFFSGRYAGAITGIGAGFLIDALGSVGLSLMPVVYMILGYVVGFYAKGGSLRRFPTYLIYLGGGVILRGIVTGIYTYWRYEGVSLGRLIIGTVLPEIGVTAPVGCVLYFPILLLCQGLERKKAQ